MIPTKNTTFGHARTWDDRWMRDGVDLFQHRLPPVSSAVRSFALACEAVSVSRYVVGGVESLCP